MKQILYQVEQFGGGDEFQTGSESNQHVQILSENSEIQIFRYNLYRYVPKTTDFKMISYQKQQFQL